MSLMHEATLDVLRHVQVHGSRTRAEVHKALPQSGHALENLAMLGYLAADGISKPTTYIVTRKGLDKLAGISTRLAPKRRLQPLPVHDTLALRYQAPSAPPRRSAAVAALRPGDYQPTEYAPSLRPGAMAAFDMPSRFGNRLHWRDGRITDLDGNPLPHA